MLDMFDDVWKEEFNILSPPEVNMFVETFPDRQSVCNLYLDSLLL